MATKTTYFLYSCCILTHNFRFLHALGLITLSIMFFDKNDLYLIFKIRMVTANTKIKTFFYACELYIKNNICLNLKNRLGNTAD